MSTPYVGFSNATLAGQPQVKRGDKITCPHCARSHELQGGTENGKPSDLLLFYKCGDTSYMAAVNGRLTMGVKADCSGSI
jgi:hypothetical protein